MGTYRIETSQGTYDIEADREPTQDEALAAIGGGSQSSLPQEPVVSTQGQFNGDSPYKDVIEALPFSNAAPEFREGQRNGQQIFGNNLAGKLTGVILGGGRSLATVLNPLSKIIGFVPKEAQAIGSMGGALSAGGSMTEAAAADLTGSRPVSSSLEIPNINTGNVNLDTLINGLGGTANEAIIKQPLSPLGLTPEALSAQGAALRSGAKATRAAIEKIAEPMRSSAPIDQEAVVRAQKKVQDLQYLQEQNRINKNATAEERNAKDIILQEELYKAKKDADDLGAAAIKANQDIGPQIDQLTQNAENAPVYAENLKGKLPQPQEPSQLNKTVQSGIEASIAKEKPLENADYSAVQESLPDVQAEREAPNLHEVASTLSKEEQAGLQSLADKRINSILKDASKVNAPEVSPELQNIYDNATDSQKADLASRYPELNGPTQSTFTWDDLQKTYQRLNSKISDAQRVGDGNAVRILSKLKDAVNSDMASYAEQEGTNTKELFDQANARFAANRQTYEGINNLALSTPKTIVSNIVGPDSVEVVNSLKKVLTPENFDQVKAQYADQLMSPSKDVPFDPDHFMKQFDRISDETLKSVFGDEGFAQLQKINDLSKSATQLNDLKSQLDEFNSQAQKSTDAYNKAKSSADKKSILDDAERRAEDALDAVKDEKFQRDIEKAREELKNAQTPEKISIIMRGLYGVLSATLASVGGPGAALAAGVAAAAFGRIVHRGAKGAIAAGIESVAKGKKK